MNLIYYQPASHDPSLTNWVHNGQNFRSECSYARNTFLLLVDPEATFFIGRVFVFWFFLPNKMTFCLSVCRPV